MSATLFDFGADIGQTITVAGSGETVKLDVDQTGLTLLTNVDGSTITAKLVMIQQDLHSQPLRLERLT